MHVLFFFLSSFLFFHPCVSLFSFLCVSFSFLSLNSTSNSISNSKYVSWGGLGVVLGWSWGGLGGVVWWSWGGFGELHMT